MKNKVLTPEQVIGKEYLMDTPRAILADDVGYGKTGQAVAACSALGLKRVLYVTGGQASYQVEEEVSIFARGMTCRVLRNEPKFRRQVYLQPPNLLVIGYETFRNDAEHIIRQSWDCMILDDASHFKNPESQLATVARSIALRTPRVWALTATPIETSLMDLWSILACCGVYPLGTWEEFSDYFCIWGTTSGPFGTKKEIKSYQHLEELKDRVSSYIIRRANTRAPKIIPLVELMGLYPEQLITYKQAYTGRFGMSVFDKFTRCLMACDSTCFTGRPWKSTKVDWILEFITGYEGKVVVYSQWKAVIRHLEEDLTKAFVGYVEISGDVPISTRVKNQKAFREDPAVKVCIVTKAGEQALNLQSAQVLITINRIANPQRMKQVHGRIARMGSVYSKVLVLDLIIANSLEEKMLTLSDTREALAVEVLNDDTPVARLSIPEMAAMLRSLDHVTPEVEIDASKRRAHQLLTFLMD